MTSLNGQHEFTCDNTSIIDRPVKVFCNGAPLEKCFYANTKTNIAKVYTGKVIGGSPEEKQVIGSITVELI